MATSSFVEKIKVNNPKVIMEYASALEAAEKAPVSPMPEPTARRITNPEEIKALLLRGIKKWGGK